MKQFKRFAALLVCAALVLGVSAPALAAGSAPVTKDENVFVMLNPDGSIRQQSVSSWLHCDTGLTGVIDRSSLSGIENLKSELAPEQNGEELLWNTDAPDVYYRGEASGTPPIEAQISYKLDGEAISAEELTGRSGHVTMELQLINHESKSLSVDGQTRNVHTPFIVLGAAAFDTADFTDLHISSGSLQTDSDRQLAVFMALPGMRETFSGLLTGELDQFDDLFVDEITLEADTEHFVMPSLMLAAATSMEELDTLSELPDMAEDLDKLDEATDTLLQGVGDLTSAIGQLKDGADQLKDGTDTLKSGTSQLKSGASELASKSLTLRDALAALNEKSGALREGAAKLQAGAGELGSAGPELEAAIAEAQQGSAQVKSQYDDLKAQFAQMQPVLQDIAVKLPVMKEELISQIQQGTLDAVGQTAGGVYDQMLAGVGDALKNANLEGMVREILSRTGREFDPVTFGATVAVLADQAGALVSQMPSRETVVAAAQQQAANDPQMAAKLAALAAQIDALDPAGLAQQAEAMMSETEALMATTDQLMLKLSDGKDDSKETLAGALNLLAAGMGDLPAGVQQLAAGINAYTDVVAKVSDGAAKLSDGATKLSEAVNALDAGAATLQDGAATLRDGTVQLKDGAQTLDEGVHTYAADGIRKLTGAEELKNLPVLSDVARAAEQQASAYTSYSGAPDGVHASVKFIYKVEAPQEAPEPQDTPEESAAPAPEQPVKSFWQRFLDLF